MRRRPGSGTPKRPRPRCGASTSRSATSTSEARRLRSEIAALEESQVYRSGQDLDALRDLVAELAGQRASAAERVADRQRRLEIADGQVNQAQRRGRDDLTKLNDNLAAAAGLGERCRVAQRPPGPVAVAESPLPAVDVTGSAGRDGAGELTEPGEGVRHHPRSSAGSMRWAGSVLQRRVDVEEVEKARGRLDTAEEQLSRAEAALDVATRRGPARHGSTRRTDPTPRRSTARMGCADQALGSGGTSPPASRRRGRAHHSSLGRPPTSLRRGNAPAAALALPVPAEPPMRTRRPRPLPTPAVAARTLRSSTTTRPCAPACWRRPTTLSTGWRNALAGVDFRLAGEREAAEEAQGLVTELAARTEPDPPRLGWQSSADHCFADLVDFAPHLGHAERAGIEAALESSGLLSARLAERRRRRTGRR